MGFFSRIFQVFVYTVILLTVIAFLPGLPPKGQFDVAKLEPTLPMEGGLAPNNILDGAVRLFENRFTAPESVASRGRDNEIFVSMHGGSIVKVFGADYDSFTEVAKIGPGCRGPWEERVCGRPLGLRFSRDGKLLVADSYLGLFKVDVDTGEKERLVDPSLAIDGAPPLLIDDLDEDADGNIYWSDASSISDLSEGTVEILAGPSGRLVKLDVTTGQNLVLMDNLHFANGVQLSPDDDFVLVCETMRNRVLRYWLKGPKAGTSDVFIGGLPGTPDNIRAKPQGGYYVSLVTVKSEGQVDAHAVVNQLPWLRRLVIRILYATKKMFDGITYLHDNQLTSQVAYKLLNTALLNSFTGNGTIVVVLDAAGNVESSLQGSSGAVMSISQTDLVGDRLFFSSPYNKYLGMIPLWKVNGEPAPKEAQKREPTIKIRPKNEDENLFHIHVVDEDEDKNQKESRRKEAVKEKKEEL